MLENRVCPKALGLLLVLGLSVYHWACRGEKTTWTFGGSCDILPNPTARVIVLKEQYGGFSPLIFTSRHS